MSRIRSASDPATGGHADTTAGSSRAAAHRPAPNGPRDQPAALPDSRASSSRPAAMRVAANGTAGTDSTSPSVRQRADRPANLHRRRDTPPSPLAYYPSNPSPALTQAALSALASAPPSTRPSYPYPFAHHSFPAGAQADTQTGTGRLNADDSSASSTSTGEADDDARDGVSGLEHEVDVEVQKWAKADRKGKGRAVEEVRGGIGGLPGEVLMQIFDLLDTSDLLSALKVNKAWCLSAFPFLWTRPSIRDTFQLASLVRVLMTPSPRLTLPYSNYVRRISLVALGLSLTDDLLLGLAACKRVERLTLSGASSISNAALRTVISKMPDIQAIDLSNTEGTDHTVLQALGESCPKLNGLNLTACKGVDGRGMKAIAEGCRSMRRIKLVGCHRQTDATIIHLVQSCPLLIELDLGRIAQLTDATLQGIWLNSVHLRELRMNGNDTITEAGFLDLEDIPENIAYGKLSIGGIPPSLVPKEYVLDHLRILDFTGCSQITDKAIARLVKLAPRTRDLTLAKCTRLTDEAVEHICKLGRHVHHLHLGHVDNLTDRAITLLARSCTRIRYLDLGCCSRLTDIAVYEIAASMTKLRRLGLVKMTQLTNDGLIMLTERRHTLERVHLSYCNKLSGYGMQHFLNKMTRLTHMSLTGINAFKNDSFKRFSKPPPEEFNDHQRESFNVFSAQGISDLRVWLNEHMVLHARSEQSTRQGSYSSASSLYAPNGGASPTEAASAARSPWVTNPYGYYPSGNYPTVRMGSAQETYYTEDDPAYDYSYAYSMYSDESPTVMQHTQQYARPLAGAGPSRYTPRAEDGMGSPGAVYGTGLEAAFASTVPSFITGVGNLNLSDEPVEMHHPPPDRHRQPSVDRSWPRIPGAYVSGRASRASSISSVDTSAGTAPGASYARRGSLLSQAQTQSAAAAFQAQYMADQSRQANTDVRVQLPTPGIPAGLVRGQSHRQRAHTTSSPLASNSYAWPARAGGESAGTASGSHSSRNPGMPGQYRSTGVHSTDSSASSSNPTPPHGRAHGGPRPMRASMGNIYAMPQAQQQQQPLPYPPPSSYHTRGAAPRYPTALSQAATGVEPGEASRSAAPGQPREHVSSTSMERNRDRSGSGSSFASLTEGLRGLGLRRQSVGQAVQAVQAAVEASPLRWVAEMVGWNPDEQHGEGSGEGRAREARSSEGGGQASEMYRSTGQGGFGVGHGQGNVGHARQRHSEGGRSTLGPR